MIRVFDLYGNVAVHIDDETGDEDAVVVAFHVNAEGDDPVYALRLHNGDLYRAAPDDVRHWSLAPLSAFRPNVSGPHYYQLKERPVMHEREHRFFTEVCFQVSEILSEYFSDGKPLDWSHIVTWAFGLDKPFVTFALSDVAQGLLVETMQVYRSDSLAESWSLNRAELKSFDDWYANALAYVVKQVSDTFRNKLEGKRKPSAIDRVKESGRATRRERSSVL